MSLVGELMSAGIAAQAAKQLAGDLTSSISAAGTTQATATLLKSAWAIVSIVANNSGVRLPPSANQPISGVLNNGSNVLTIYPATGEKINAGSVNAGIQVAPGKHCLLIPLGNQWFANIGA